MFKLVTENCSDMRHEFYEENDIEIITLTTILDGVSYGHGKDLDVSEFYKGMRAGSKPTTSQANPEEAKEIFERLIKDNDEILYLGMSSGISGTVGSVTLGAQMVMDEHPDKKIICIDTLCASIGQGLIVWHAARLRKEGKSIDEVAQWVLDNRQNIIHVFTVDDLYDLWRGGRVSKTSAAIGTLAGIKPVLHVDEAGKLVPVEKVRGRKKSLMAMVDFMEEHMGSRKSDNEIFYTVAHGDCLEDAEFVKAEVEKRFGFKNGYMSRLGTIIGAHTGPTLVVLCFMGDVR